MSDEWRRWVLRIAWDGFAANTVPGSLFCGKRS